MPIYVSAGLISVFGSLFSGDLDSNNDVNNVQSMKILAAAISPSNDPYYRDDMVVDGSALLSTHNVYGVDQLHTPKSDQISIYVVRPGDTLSQIAVMFDVSVNTIKWSNDITGNTLKVGETLVILPISGVKHIVTKGETLASIAKKYKGDIDEIAGFNDLSSGSSLAVGTEIIIPDGEITTTSGSIVSGVSSGLKEIIGYFMRPINGGRKTQGMHGHNGVDLASSLNTPIMASASGQVIVARSSGWNGGYGNYVVIKHSNGTQTLYAHMSSLATSAGETVKQGEVIGFMGSTGKSTGIHLHFEIRGAKNPF